MRADSDSDNSRSGRCTDAKPPSYSHASVSGSAQKGPSLGCGLQASFVCIKKATTTERKHWPFIRLRVATKKNPKPCGIGAPYLLPQLRLCLGGGILSGDGEPPSQPKSSEAHTARSRSAARVTSWCRPAIFRHIAVLKRLSIINSSCFGDMMHLGLSGDCEGPRVSANFEKLRRP
jgi:hypothetical protein